MKKNNLIWMSLFLILFAGMSYATEVTIFGPSQYSTTQGGTATYNDTFTASAGQATLTVKNGEYTGSHRVDNAISSARVLINGVEIFSPNDFNQTTYLLESPITVGESNSITAELNGSEGRYITVEITQQVVNGAPNAFDDAYSSDEDGTLNVPSTSGVLANDTDPDSDPLTAVLVTGTSNGALNLNTDGSFTYSPNSDFNGWDSFTYKANDGQADSNVATVQITVNAVNDAPVALDDAYAVDEDSTLNAITSVLENDSDVDGDTLTAVLVATTSNGSLTLTADGTFTYAPNADFNGTDSFTYTADDGLLNGNTSTVTITVNAVNDTPVASNDAYTVDEDGVLNALTSVLVNDSDIDGDAMTAILVSSTSNGTLALNADGTFTYTPNADFNGLDSFAYMANDGTTDSNVATVQITVNAVNDAPVAANDSYTVDEDGTLNVSAAGALANDTDADGDPLTASLVTNVSNGTLSLNSDGSFTYTPNSDYNGTDTFTYEASDGTLQSGAAIVSITVNPMNDMPTANAGQDQAVFTGDTVQLDGSGSGDIDGDPLTYSWIITSAPTGSTSTLSSSTVVNPTIVPDIAGTYVVELIVNDGQADSLPDSMTITAEASGPQLPPDPASVAPPVDQTVATTVYDSTAFIYTGSNPIQTGVDPLDIKPQRTAVLRGKVLDRSNAPLDSVTLTILDHPEFGQTLSRTDGMFDMVVNGGGELTVVYEKENYLPVQRQISVPWQDYTSLPDVVMIQLDSQVTPIDLALGVIQAAQGSVQTDADGTRQETILFPSGTSAEMVMPDGSIQPITSINVRATEYTVGDNGPNAMPAELPPTTAYTYAVALTVDEAIAAGAETVTFSQPVYSYVENFLGFPTGIAVPVGYYDPKSSAWIPSDNGLIIEILGITGGIADLDVDGSGLPADSQTLVNLGITTEERMQLAGLYSIGQSLWRVPVTHFTNYDKNYGYSAQAGAEDPQNPESQKDQQEECFDTSYGSVIECENQVLGEVKKITGTPFTLNYRSNRVPGRTASNQLDITLSGDSVPSVLKRIDLEILIAGKMVKESFPAAPNQSYVYTFDGKDVYGRTLHGGQRAIVRIGYVYDGYYNLPPYVVKSFGLPSGTIIPGDAPARLDVILWQTDDTYVGEWDARSAGLGGWTLSEHHTYDPLQKAIFLGDGGRRSAEENSLIIDTASGTGIYGYSGDGGLATEAKTGYPHHINISPDGSLYFADFQGHRIRKVDPDGIITTVAGNGSYGFSGDGGPATQASLRNPYGVDIGPDGSLYIVDWGNYRIRKVDPDGIITTVAGAGAYGDSGDGGPATQATFRDLTDVAVAPDGSFYITDMNSYRVRKVDQSGIITTVAGTGNHGYTGDGGSATSANLSYPRGIDIGPDGSLYIAQQGYGVIRKVDPSGIITTVAGTSHTGYNGDGILATSAWLNVPRDVAVGSDGSLYVADCGNGRVRKVNPEGIITTVAGGGIAGEFGDNGPSTKGWIQCPSGVAISPGGILYVSDYGKYRIRGVKSGFPAFDDSDIAIASEDGSKLYQFNSQGKHLSTVDTLTNAVLYQFSYDSNGYLSSIVDVDGDVTTIQRDANGDPTAIISHDGQQTTITLDAKGFISNITNPANESTDFVYTSNGLLTSVTDPRQNTSIITYDAEGRLTKDTNAAGGFWQLERTDYADGYTVDKTSALGRLTTYDVTSLSDGNRQRLVTDPAGLTTETLTETNGSTTVTSPDGSVTTIQQGPDPRFGMQSPISKSLSVVTPGGLSYTHTANRNVTLEFNNEPLSLLTMTDTVNTNGRTSTGVYNATNRIYTLTTPEGRQSTTLLDALGRVIQYQIAGLEPINYSYDTRGRLDGILTGTVPDDRIYTFTYDAEGFLDSITDPLGHTTSYLNDPVGRTTRQTLPDLREIDYGYDANGNVTSITPPGRPAHAFDYNAVNLTSFYDPPDIGITPDTTTYSYSLDKEMIQILRPDADTIGFTYNTAGQLTAMNIPGGAYTYTYDPATGQLTTINDPDGGTLSYTYDGSLLIDETWSGNVTGTVTRSYNNNFWVTSLSVNGSAIAYSYDNDGLLTGAGSLMLSRNAQNGLLTGITLGNVTTSLSHNGFAEVTGESASYSSTPIYDSSFVYDKLGRITQKTETVDSVTTTHTYGYDLAGRLETVSENSTVVSTYAYDDNGNRLSLTTSGGTISGTYDDQDRLTGYGNATYTYTANGELETKAVGADTTVYDYDELGNLISVTLPDGTFIEYIIDGLNRRVAKLVNGIFIEGFLYESELYPAAKIDDTGNVIERYVYADKGNVPAYMIKGGITYRIISDHLGSSKIVVDANTGAIVQRMDYDEFGNVILDTTPGFQPFGFAGGLYDHLTGLVRFGVRDYDPETGRWTAKDPIRFKGGDTNLYGYVINDPINWIDPWGLQKEATLPLVSDLPLLDGVKGACKLAAASLSAPVLVGAAVGTAIVLIPSTAETPLDENDMTPWYASENNKVDKKTAKGHRKKRPSTWDKHSKQRPGGPEKGDDYRRPPRRRPPGTKGPWPPKKK
jgi:RHS repeat-associated protein